MTFAAEHGAEARGNLAVNQGDLVSGSRSLHTGWIVITMDRLDRRIDTAGDRCMLIAQ